MSLDARYSSVRDTREGSFRVDPEELPALGLPPPSILAVAKNTLIVADTFGFHARGPCTGPALRVAIWATLPRQPFLPWAMPLPATLAAWRDALGRGWAAGIGESRTRAHPAAGFSPFDMTGSGAGRPG